jgi:chromate transporter
VLGAGLVGYLAARAGVAFLSGVGHADADGVDEAERISADAAQHAMRAAAVFLLLWLAPTALLLITLGGADVFTQIALFFSKMAVVTFGGAYAVLSYVAQQAVERFHWLTPAEMLDGLGMAETTPGPLIMVLQFVGFMAAFRNAGVLPPLLAGALGGLLATWVTFAPCFLWIFLGAPYVERLRGNRALSGALAAISAAVVGVIANLALWFATHFLFRDHRMIEGCCYAFDMPMLASVDLAALALSAAAAAALLRFNLGVAKTLALSVAAGLLLRMV